MNEETPSFESYTLDETVVASFIDTKSIDGAPNVSPLLSVNPHLTGITTAIRVV